MRQESFEFISEAILVEKMVKEYLPIEKNAGLFEGLGLNTISSYVGSYIKENMQGSPGKWILKLFATGMIFKIHPVLGIIAAIADQFGFGVSALIDRFGSALKPKLEAGKQFSLDELNNIGKSITESVAGPLKSEPGIEASIGFYGIMKYAWGRGYNTGLAALLGKLSPSVSRWTISGIVWFIIKTLLLGAGLVAGAGIVSSFFKKDDKSTTTTPPSSTSEPGIPSVSSPVGSSILKPSGRGQQNFANDSANIWIVPLVGGSIEDTLLLWAVDIYPELDGKEVQIEALPSFDYVSNMLHQNFDLKNPDHLVMPQGYHSRKEVVDLFSKEAEKLVVGAK